MKTSKPKKRPVGRPRIDPTGAQRPYSVKLGPGDADHLVRVYGSVSGGVRKLIERDRTRENGNAPAG